MCVGGVRGGGRGGRGKERMGKEWGWVEGVEEVGRRGGGWEVGGRWVWRGNGRGSDLG